MLHSSHNFMVHIFERDRNYHSDLRSSINIWKYRLRIAYLTHNSREKMVILKTRKHPLKSVFTILLLYCLLFSYNSCCGVLEVGAQPTNAATTTSFQLQWSNFTVQQTQSYFLLPSPKASNNKRSKSIINIPSGSFESGRLVGILGPSGCGKSTFLKTLAGRLSSNLKLDGDVSMVSFNGNREVLSETSMPQERVAFVYQDDAFFDVLSVRETLLLALNLRQQSTHYKQPASNHIGNSNNDALVDEVIRMMGLQKIQHSRVGKASASTSFLSHEESIAISNVDGNSEVKMSEGQVKRQVSGLKTSSVSPFSPFSSVSFHKHHTHGSTSGGSISGGERKRLAVACELLGNPLLLIADEPTSGLDTFQALQVIQLLHNITRQRPDLLILTTMHQPRSQIFSLCDDVILFTPNGKFAYHGPRENILNYFKTYLQYPCPADTNPAEFFIDLVSMDFTSAEAYKQSIQRIALIEEAFLRYSRSIQKEKSKIHGNILLKSLNPSTDQYHSSSLLSTEALLMQPFQQQQSIFTFLQSKVVQPVQQSIKRILILYQRAMTQLFRDAQVSVVRACVSVVLAMIITTVYAADETTFAYLDDYSNIDDGSSSRKKKPNNGFEDYSRSPQNLNKSTRKQVITPESIPLRVNLIAQTVINVAMLSTVKTLQLLQRERTVVLRELTQRHYNGLEYLIAKIAAEFPVDAIMSMIFGGILKYCCSQTSTSSLSSNNHHHRIAQSPAINKIMPSKFGNAETVASSHSLLLSPMSSFLSIVSLLSITCSSLGLAIGAMFPVGETALSVGPALMVVYIILGAIGPAGVRQKADAHKANDNNNQIKNKKNNIIIDNAAAYTKKKSLLLLKLPAQKLSVLSLCTNLSPIKWASEALCALEFREKQITPPYEMRKTLHTLLKKPVHTNSDTNMDSSSNNGNNTYNRSTNVVKSLWKKLVALVKCIPLFMGRNNNNSIDNADPYLFGNNLNSQNINNNVQGGVRSSSSQQKEKTTGEFVLSSLGIGSSNVSESVSILLQMTGLHLLLAWIGLSLSRNL